MLGMLVTSHSGSSGDLDEQQKEIEKGKKHFQEMLDNIESPDYDGTPLETRTVEKLKELCVHPELAEVWLRQTELRSGRRWYGDLNQLRRYV